jgi:hypothetical protein
MLCTVKDGVYVERFACYRKENGFLLKISG